MIQFVDYCAAACFGYQNANNVFNDNNEDKEKYRVLEMKKVIYQKVVGVILQMT
jgi:hypothetical protein